MAVEFREYDEHGFPVAPRFADIKYHEDQPPAGPKFSPASKRLLFAGIIVALVGLIFGQQIVSAGHELVSRWFASRAERKFQVSDFTGALADLTTAIEWNPANIELLFRRALWRCDINDLGGSLSDWNELIAQLKNPDPALAARNRAIDRTEYLIEAYCQRSWVFQRLGRGRESIDDANDAVKIRPSPRNLNLRAYARAIANMELQEGLDDINKALAQPLDNTIEFGTFLDTRGYLLHLLGRDDEALKDMDQAIAIATQERRMLIHQTFRINLREADADLKQTLAVMYHHRGLVQEKLGHNDEAQSDLRRGKEMGYDPANGVM